MIVVGLVAVIITLLISWYFTFHQESYTGSLDIRNQKLIIFDFDGTLCDSLQFAVNEFNTLSSHWKLKPITNIDELRNLPTHRALRKYGVSLWKLPILRYKLVKSIAPQIINMKPPIGLHEALSQLKKSKFTLGILTSNSNENTQRFLKYHNMNFFDFIYSGSSIFGKARLLNKIILKTKPSIIFYVGDESRDIEAAKKVNIPSIAVTWGYNSKAQLSTLNPSYIANSPLDLHLILEGNP